MAMTCDFATLSQIDSEDPEALQALLQQCTDALLDPSLWMWALIFTLVCALVGAAIGWRKGRWVAGVVWSLVLGPIGWIVIAFAKPASALPVAKTPPRPPICPDCGRANVFGANFCANCGGDLRRPPPIPRAAEAAPPRDR